MPIVIPTVDEVERMDARQREAIVKRLDADRERAADAIALLTGRPRPYARLASRAKVRAAMRRSAQRRKKDEAAAIVADARSLLARMPADPEAAIHVERMLAAVA